VPGCHRRQLYLYRDLYCCYPRIVRALSAQFADLLPSEKPWLPKVGAVRPLSGYAPEEIINCLSYTHLQQLVQLDEPLKRAFYEAECIRGNWSVRELKRQIATLYYERSALSKDKAKLAALVRRKAEPAQPADAIRDPYVFEFLGLKPHEALSESALEDSLLDKLQEFLLELGRGFCFEARQKRLLIGGDHFFVDLVFYHRILKCHVLIELKVDSFAHEYLGQLNTYVTWYRAHEMAPGDNSPIGILLCTQKNHALVEYALAGMDNRLFVSKYRLALPAEREIRRFLETQIHALAPPPAVAKKVPRRSAALLKLTVPPATVSTSPLPTRSPSSSPALPVVVI
jgi:predicted nuclease of restriction endonuclease-like (RecB) superfamily